MVEHEDDRDIIKNEYAGSFCAETPRISECEISMLEHEDDKDIVENEYAGSFCVETPLYTENVKFTHVGTQRR